jgi:hypothetical protein
MTRELPHGANTTHNSPFKNVFSVATEACLVVAFGAKTGDEAHLKCRRQNDE